MADRATVELLKRARGVERRWWRRWLNEQKRIATLIAQRRAKEAANG